MTLYEHPLKNAYIGGYYEYSYDFRGKSTSQLTADGWTLPSGASCDSGGYYTTSFDGIAKFVLPTKALTALTNASKVTLTSQVNTTNNFRHSVYVWKENYQHRFGNYLAYSTVSGSGITTSQYAVINAADTTHNTWSPSGVITATLTIDFSNLTWNWDADGHTNSGTITQTVAGYLKQNTTLRMKLDDHGSAGARLQKLELSIEI